MERSSHTAMPKSSHEGADHNSAGPFETSNGPCGSFHPRHTHRSQYASTLATLGSIAFMKLILPTTPYDHPYGQKLPSLSFERQGSLH
jgi:hypothetical protein